MNKQELFALIDKYLAGQATEEEIDLLSRYYNSFQQNSAWNNSELGSEPDTEKKILEGIRRQISLNDKEEIQPTAEGALSYNQVGVINLKEKRKVLTLTNIGIAACLIGLIVLFILPTFKNKRATESPQTTSSKHAHSNNVLPASDKAILKLADGSSIELDQARNGALAQQGNTKVIKVNGRLSYTGSSALNEVLYNTISTPRGGKYQLEFSDGSQVWLNAASSLRFPTAFSGKERKVEITGEAYFEIVKNTSMPFIVSVNGATVEVLGTSFNVMAYNEESSLETTLVEGSVSFMYNNVSNILRPGQQSQLSKNGQIKVANGIDLEEVLAWKNGAFHFQAADIGTVMRQLSRWYDVEIVYHKKIDDLFYAEIPRNTQLSDVLKALELTGKVHFEVENRTIIVNP